MTIYEFLLYILSPLGLQNLILSPVELINIFSAFQWENWGCILSPNVIVSSIIYISFVYAIFFLLFVMPFRFFKQFINVPKRSN